MNLLETLIALSIFAIVMLSTTAMCLQSLHMTKQALQLSQVLTQQDGNAVEHS